MQDAREGSSFAEAEYEKWKDAHRKAKADLEATLARHQAERQSLLDERELIKQIMRYIGVLHDVKATEKSIAAGGRDSIKDEETGVSDPYADQHKAISPQVLKAKVAELQALVLKSNNQAQKMVDDTYAKMLEWEKKLVLLAAEADKAKEKMLREKLQREKLAGDKDVATEVHDTESAAYKLVITLTSVRSTSLQ